MTSQLAGKSVAVVGASSGIGRGFAVRASGAGAELIVSARRHDLLETLIEECNGGAAVACDLLDEADVGRLATAVRERTAQLDVLFISAGAAPLARLHLTTVKEWRAAIDTNVIGINSAISGLLDILTPTSVVVVVSSEAAVAPRSHLGAYGASKAALEHSVEQWREEHPWMRITTVSLGATVPTDFGRSFETDPLMEALEAWSESGRNQTAFMGTDEVCDVLIGVVETLLAARSVGIPRLVLRSPSPASRDAEAVAKLATDAGNR